MSKIGLLLVILINGLISITSYAVSIPKNIEMWGITEHDMGKRIYSKASIDSLNHIKFSNHIETADGHYEQLFCEGRVNWQTGKATIKGENSTANCVGDYMISRVSEQCFILDSVTSTSNKQTFFVCDE
ncbi:hypothetical protein [Vibrio owensii]|uniref:hypothetical protein n=1 Tax=Vibrio owensii TaxID=696485 RepID=UPI003AAC1F6D